MEENCGLDLLSICSKRPRHDDFIPVNDFKLAHLPTDCRDDNTYESIKVIGSLTCRILVQSTSEKRPNLCPVTGDPYPFNTREATSDAGTRAGSGFVSRVSIRDDSDSSNTFDQCTAQTEHKQAWAEIVITTARHVVFDTTEARSSSVELFYDEEENRQHVRVLKGQSAFWGFRDVGWDICWISCITHDLELAKDLQGLLHKSRGLHAQMIQKSFKRTRDFSFSSSSQLLLMDEISNSDCESSFHADQSIHSFTEMPNEAEENDKELNSSNEFVPNLAMTSYTTNSQRKTNGSSYSAAIVENSKRGLETDEKERKQMSNKIKRIQMSDSSIVTTNNAFETTVAQRNVNGLSQMECLIKPTNPETFLNLPDIETSPRWRLAVIISHPHGCSKRITFGEWVERTEAPHVAGNGHNHFTRYIYDTPTCPGSSGAPLWLMHSTNFFRHVHSRSLNGHLNQSSIGVDSSSFTLFAKLMHWKRDHSLSRERRVKAEVCSGSSVQDVVH